MSIYEASRANSEAVSCEPTVDHCRPLYVDTFTLKIHAAISDGRTKSTLLDLA